MLSFKSAFSLSSSIFIKRLFSSSLLSAVRMVSSAYLRLLIFLPAILILAWDSSSPEFCQENTLDIANTFLQQHKRRLHTWTSPDGQYRNQIDYILCSQRWRNLYSQQKQDWELTVAQIMNSLLPNSDLKKVEKTTRPFR